MSYALPIIRTVVRVHEWRVRVLEQQLAELKRNKPHQQMPEFNRYPWPWRQHGIQNRPACPRDGGRPRGSR